MLKAHNFRLSNMGKKAGAFIVFSFFVILVSAQSRVEGENFRPMRGCLITIVTCHTISPLGLVAELQGGNNAFSLGVVKGYYNRYFYRNYITGAQASFSLGHLPHQNLNTITLAVNTNTIFPKWGVNAGIRFTNYFNNSIGISAVRPQAGIVFNECMLNYGYDIFLSEEATGLQKHNITLSWYFYVPRLSITRYLRSMPVPKRI